MTAPKITPGTVKKRADGLWYARYWIDGVEVKHVARTKPAVVAKRDARVAAVRAEAELAETMSLATAWAQWYEVRGKRKRLGTRRNYDLAIAQLCEFVGPDTPLALVGRDELEAFESALADEGHLLSSIRTKRRSLTPMFRWAAGAGRIPVNPFDGLELPDAPASAAPEYLDLADARILTKYLSAELDDYHVAGMLMLHGGLRIGEALGLPWHHVDLPGGRLRVRQQATENAGEGRRISPKLKTEPYSRREITLSPPLAEVLRRQRAAAPDVELVCSAECSSRRGTDTPLGQRTVRTRLAAAYRDAGVPYIKPHGLRHTAGSMVYAATKDLTETARFLGHANLVLVQRLYVHGITDTDAGAAIGSLGFD